MMSELVAGSAWIWPPVEGDALGDTAVVAGLPAAPAAPPAESDTRVVDVLRDEPSPPPTWPASAARSVVARDVASAFFR